MESEVKAVVGLYRVMVIINRFAGLICFVSFVVLRAGVPDIWRPWRLQIWLWSFPIFTAGCFAFIASALHAYQYNPTRYWKLSRKWKIPDPIIRWRMICFWKRNQGK